MGITVGMLDNGCALIGGTVDPDAKHILTTRGLDMITRHFLTLECVRNIDLHMLRNLGCAHGLDLRARSSDVITYARMVLAIDTLPGQADPGPVLRDGSGRTMTPQALAQPLARAVAEADLEVRKQEAAALAVTSYPSGLPVSGGGGGVARTNELVEAIKEVTGERAGAKPKAVTVPEIGTIRQAVDTKWGFVPLKNEHGDGKALGQARYWCVTHKCYPGPKQMSYLTVENASGGETVGRGPVYFNEAGQLETEEAVCEKAVSPSNATGHVELFARKIMTILMITHDEDVRPGQEKDAGSSLRRASTEKQLTYGDVRTVCAVLRSYQTRVSHDKMSVALEAYESAITSLVEGTAMYTLGAALLHALERTSAMLDLFVASSLVEKKTKDRNFASPVSGGGDPNAKKRTLEKIENENLGLKAQVANLKGNSQKRGNWAYNPGADWNAGGGGGGWNANWTNGGGGWHGVGGVWSGGGVDNGGGGKGGKGGRGGGGGGCGAAAA